MEITEPRASNAAISRTLLRRREFFPRTKSVIHQLGFSFERYGTVLLIAGDVAAWWLAFLGAMALFPESALHVSFLWTAPMVGTATLYLIGSYDKRTDFLRAGFVSESIIAILSATVFSMFLAYVVSTFNLSVKPSRAFIPILFGLFTLYSIYVRRVYGIYFRRHRAERAFLILGAGAEARNFYRHYTESSFGWNLEFVDPAGTTAGTCIDGKGSPVIETDVMAKLADGQDRYAGVLLACDAPQLPSPVLLRLIKMQYSNVPVVTMEAFHELRWDRVSSDAVGPKWIFDREFRLANNSVYSNLKRLLDILVAASALIFLIPAMLVIAWSIRLESTGPVLFRQRRVGRVGRIFTMLKFRTMQPSNNGDIYTRQGDQRVTPLGRWLRRYRLDELPQLWNVLTGDMSLIGPRAEWVKCVEIYEKEIPLYHLRHLVKPGITGWAQVKFKYGESKSDTITKFEYDLYYIRHFSLHLDVTIVLKTIHTMICGKGR